MSNWGYEEDNGPDSWCKCYPDAAGKRQSPINIVTTEAKYDLALNSTAPLAINYVKESGVVVENCGYSFKVNMKNQSEIEGGPLDSTYRLEQFHIHWGGEDGRGSEHTINGKSYAAELHLVHWNCSKYKSFGDAVKEPDGLAVFGIMLEIGNEYAGFKPITDLIEQVQKAHQTYTVPELFDVSSLLPSDTSSYWTYLGSLTTPPCYESVTWIVFKTPLTMSKDQVNRLRSLLDSENDGGKCIVDNYRPPVPLGDRSLRASFAIGQKCH